MLPMAWVPMLRCRTWAVPENESIPRFQKQAGGERHRRPLENVPPKRFQHQFPKALSTTPSLRDVFVFQAAFLSQATTKGGSAAGGASPPLFSCQPQRAFVQ
jgi:hypothetical protein